MANPFRVQNTGWDLYPGFHHYRRRPNQVVTRVLVVLLACFIAPAIVANVVNVQSPDDDKVFEPQDVDVKARIKNQLEQLPVRNSDCPPSVQVTLRIVLRKFGKVSDISVLRSSGCSYDKEAMKVASRLKFDPALKGGQPVSQYSQIEYATKPGGWPRAAPSTPDIQSGNNAILYGLVLDQSGTKENFAPIRAAAKAIVNSNTLSDQTFITTFIDPHRIQTLGSSSDKALLVKSLDEFAAGDGEAAIIDAVYVSMQYLLSENSSSSARHALVLVTHGDERGSLYKLDQLLQALRQNRVRVYILGYVNVLKAEHTKRQAKAIEFIKKLAKESGGEAIVVDRADETEAKAAALMSLLRR